MAGNGISSSQTATWCNRLKEYSIATFTTGVDEIFGANGSTGNFPTFEDLADPVETGKKLPDKSLIRSGNWTWHVIIRSKLR